MRRSSRNSRFQHRRVAARGSRLSRRDPLSERRGFYDDDKGTNYGQSRYLCYYLQEKGLLIKFYREFYLHQKTDPTGYQSLQKVLGEADMERFKRKWQRYVLGLSQQFELRPIAPQ